MDIDFEDAMDITRETLIQMLEDIEVVGDEKNIPVWDALNEVLAYLCTPEELDDLQGRYIHDNFVGVLVNDTLNKFYKRLKNGSN
jgi:hypothetical protein